MIIQKSGLRNFYPSFSFLSVVDCGCLVSYLIWGGSDLWGGSRPFKLQFAFILWGVKMLWTLWYLSPTLQFFQNL